MSRWHLKSLQDDTLDDYTRTVNSGVVGENYDEKAMTIGSDTWEWDETPEGKSGNCKVSKRN